MSKSNEKIPTSSKKVANKKDNYHPNDLDLIHPHPDIPPVTIVTVDVDDGTGTFLETLENENPPTQGKVKRVTFTFDSDQGPAKEFLPVIITVNDDNHMFFNPSREGHEPDKKSTATCKKDGLKYTCTIINNSEGKVERVNSRTLVEKIEWKNKRGSVVSSPSTPQYINIRYKKD